MRGRWAPPPTEGQGSRKGQGQVAGGQYRVSRSFGNEYFRVLPNISESELDLLIPNILNVPNISEYFRK